MIWEFEYEKVDEVASHYDNFPSMSREVDALN